MTREELVRKIDTAVEELTGELTAFACEIFAIPTQNPPGYNYDKCTKAIGAMMEKIGMEVEYVHVPTERLDELAPKGQGLPRMSVVGTLKGETLRPNIHFTGHFDVVPEGTNWTHDPYGCDIVDGNIYARGSADQKSGIVSELIAALALKKAGIKLKGTYIASATPDEETGGQAGVGYMVEQGYFTKESTDYCVITECLDVDKICLGHRGTLWFEITVKGKQSHGSQPSEGVNPIEFINRLLNVIKEDIDPLIAKPTPLPVMPPACRKTTLTVTGVHAGENVNSIPAEALVTFDWRLIPELSVSWAKEQIEKALEKVKAQMPGTDYTIKYVGEDDPTLVSEDMDVVRALQRNGREYLGRDMEFSVSPGMDDQKYVVQKGKMEQCIVYGPGRLTLAHKSDEFANIEEMKTSAKIMALSAAELLGVAD
ncbi:MAG: ArgE/DapE family deacylase [Eubacteriales bacterium]|nr:ArgE/DapE family deacylase [Eubacteriales bacterium]